jgi:hypothetical protein
MEDLCQLTERLTEHKYDGSHEQVAKAILKYSANPGLDVVNYYELVLFSFLTGNADMHLKNFSLLQVPNLGYGLAPAYDLVATALVNPADTEELALTLNGKKRRLRQADFRQAALRAGVSDKVMTSIFTRFIKAMPAWQAFIGQSFVPVALQEQFDALLVQRFAQLELAYRLLSGWWASSRLLIRYHFRVIKRIPINQQLTRVDSNFAGFLRHRQHDCLLAGFDEVLLQVELLAALLTRLGGGEGTNFYPLIHWECSLIANAVHY